MNDLLVIIPAYNEEMNIIKVVKEVKEEIKDADILVVNDSSTDNTLNVLRENNINYITTPYNLNYSGAIQTGFKYAAKKGYKYVAQFDGDGQHIASELSKLYMEAKLKNYDIVIGSRFIQKTNYKHSLFRKIGTLLFKHIIKAICSRNITDPTSGMQVLNRKVYTKYAKIGNYPEYPDANLIIEMLILGYSIKEIPVEMREREFGVSMHSGIWKPFTYMIRMIYSIIIILLRYKGVKKMKMEMVGENNGTN